jgi:hypothetical protein
MHGAHPAHRTLLITRPSQKSPDSPTLGMRLALAGVHARIPSPDIARARDIRRSNSAATKLSRDLVTLMFALEGHR